MHTTDDTDTDRDTFAVRAQHVSTTAAYREARLFRGERELTDSAAVTIAATWQSPGTVGRTLAALASGAPVTVSDVLYDIAATRQELRTAGALTYADNVALDMLATWTLAQDPTRTTRTTRTV